MDKQDYEKLEITKDDLFVAYVEVHTTGKSNEEFKSLVTLTRNFLASENCFDKFFTYFKFYDILKDFLKNSKVRHSTKEAALLFKDLQKAYQKIEKYGIRLWKHPWRKEFYTIKLFTTFFKLEIESKDSKAASILELYGYREKSKNIIEMQSPPDLDRISLVSFELFLSTIELEILFEIASNIEDYAEHFSLNSVLRARRKVNGNVDEVVEYLLKDKGLSPKRIKTDDDKLDASKENTTGRKSNRDTKYPPSSDFNRNGSSDNHGFFSTNGKTRVTHVSSSIPSVDNLSDRELYGHNNASPSNSYTDMGSDTLQNEYECMDRFDTITSLPPPLHTEALSVHDQGIPPPTYYQATQTPGVDYVVVEKQDSRAGYSSGTSNTIPDVSYINICENGPDSRALGVGSAASKQGVYPAYDAPLIVSKTAFEKISTRMSSSASHYQAPQEESTKLRAANNSFPKEDYDMVKGRGDIYRNPIPSAKDISATELYERPLHSVENVERSSKNGKDLERKVTSLYDTKMKDPQYLSNTKNLSKEMSSKGSSGIFDVPKTKVLYTTSSYSKGSTSVVSSGYQTGTVMTRSQARIPELRERSQEASETTLHTERYSVHNCNVCKAHVTSYYCKICRKRYCKDCVHVVARLLCDDYKEHRFVEESGATKEKEQASNKQDYSTCRYCGTKMPSNFCICCNMKSCDKCCNLYKNDVCASNNFQPHFFLDQQHHELTSEVTEVESQRQPKPASNENPSHLVSHVNGENVCDFCGLIANLICKTCLKTVCDTCLYAYEQDLCPPTKKEHQFENILMQSNQTTSQDSDSPWECQRCTFLNSQNHRICAVCATSRGNTVECLPKSGSRKCSNCTFGNEEGATVCKMCSCTFGLDKPESYI